MSTETAQLHEERSFAAETIARRVGAPAMAVLGALLVTAPGSAAVHQVTVGADAGPGSYRQAILDANGDVDPVVIQFDPNLVVNLSSSVAYTNSQPITIQGNGSTIDGFDLYQILEATATSSIVVDDVTMRRGYATVDGGAIEASGASVTVTDSAFLDNTADNDGGAIRSSGGSFDISNSTFQGNEAGNDGGALRAAGGSYVVVDSTFADNTAGNDGGALRSSSGAYDITNSTFSSNSAAGAGGGAIRTSSGTATLTYVTMVSNSASSGAHVTAEELVTSGSMFADALGGGASCDLDGPTSTVFGFNYATDASCGLTDATDTQNGADPMLDPLADNGGATQTRQPAANSPLIDAIDLAQCGPPAPATDQRGIARPQGMGCDIGAVEFTGSLQSISEVPTVSVWGLLVLLVALGGIGLAVSRRA